VVEPQADGTTIQTHGQDKYGRTLGDVFLEDGTNVNQDLVKQGWCWWYRKYEPGNVILEKLERRARASGIGLWADPHPVPPWEWRKRKYRYSAGTISRCCRILALARVALSRTRIVCVRKLGRASFNVLP